VRPPAASVSVQPAAVTVPARSPQAAPTGPSANTRAAPPAHASAALAASATASRRTSPPAHVTCTAPAQTPYARTASVVSLRMSGPSSGTASNQASMIAPELTSSTMATGSRGVIVSVVPRATSHPALAPGCPAAGKRTTDIRSGSARAPRGNRWLTAKRALAAAPLITATISGRRSRVLPGSP